VDMVDTKHEQNLGLGAVLARTGAFSMPTLVGLAMVFFITGVGGYRGGWLWAPLITTPPLAAVGFWGWGPRRGRMAATAVLAGAGVALGVWFSQTSLLSAPRLRAAMDSLAVPEGYELLAEERGGWALCFDECTYFTRTFAVPGDSEEAKAALVEVLGRQGFTLGPWRRSSGAEFIRGQRGRLGLAAYIDPRTGRHDGPAPLPPGNFEIHITLDTYGGNPL